MKNENILNENEKLAAKQILTKCFNLAMNQLYKIGYTEIQYNNYDIDIKNLGSKKLATCQCIYKSEYNLSGDYIITFNSYYIKYGEEKQWQNTMMHELIHSIYGCMKHTGKWKYIANIVNNRFPSQYKIMRTSIASDDFYNNTSSEKYKYCIECNKCHSKWKYKRMSKTVQCCTEGKATCSCGGRQFTVTKII